MEQKPPLPMTPFDHLISSSQMQMMKVMLPYLPPGNQKFFAVYIKFMELQHTMQYFHGFHTDLHVQSASPDLSGLLAEMRPYMNEKDADAIEQMMNMMHMMEMVKDMGGMDGFNGQGQEGMDPMSMMMNMMSPEQKDAFASYNDMFNDLGEPTPDTTKGAGTNGTKLDESSRTEEYGPSETGTDPDRRRENGW